MGGMTDPHVPEPTTSTGALWSRPTSRAGSASGWSALVAVVSLIAANTLLRDASGIVNTLRGIGILVFAVGGVAALALAIRALTRGERSIVMWLGLLIGAAAMLLMIAEFTFLE